MESLVEPSNSNSKKKRTSRKTKRTRKTEDECEKNGGKQATFDETSGQYLCVTPPYLEYVGNGCCDEVITATQKSTSVEKVRQLEEGILNMKENKNLNKYGNNFNEHQRLLGYINNPTRKRVYSLVSPQRKPKSKKTKRNRNRRSLDPNLKFQENIEPDLELEKNQTAKNTNKAFYNAMVKAGLANNNNNGFNPEVWR